MRLAEPTKDVGRCVDDFPGVCFLFLFVEGVACGNRKKKRRGFLRKLYTFSRFFLVWVTKKNVVEKLSSTKCPWKAEVGEQRWDVLPEKHVFLWFLQPSFAPKRPPNSSWMPFAFHKTYEWCPGNRINGWQMVSYTFFYKSSGNSARNLKHQFCLMIVSIGWWFQTFTSKIVGNQQTSIHSKAVVFRVPGGSYNHWPAESAFLGSWSYLSPIMSTALLQNGVTSLSDFNCRIHHLFWKPSWNPTDLFFRGVDWLTFKVLCLESSKPYASFGF